MGYNLKWRRVDAPYEVIAVVPIDQAVWRNVRIRGSQFQVKSFQGTWFAVFVIGDDSAPQIAIGRADDSRLDNNYRIAGTNCLQLKNFDTGNFFTIVGVFSPPVAGFLNLGDLQDPNNDRDTSTTPATYRIINITTGNYCAPWILDDEAGGLSVAFECAEPPAEIYRADTTILTADLTTYTADYSY
jgi:hypothetical protein